MEEKVFTEKLSEILAIDTDEGEILTCLDLRANKLKSDNNGLVVEVKDGSKFLLLITKIN